MPDFLDESLPSDFDETSPIPDEASEFLDDAEEEIDLKALADEIFSLILKEIKLEKERLGQ